ncbi:MAG: hypothetical protein F9K40_06585 [Kofleriaceae bacterium]|nr:MAG: hypothetical protein F9K40_06585 [Kofleriaceae bacterium]MBZ0233801.1 hypothetical protein [Kofleriaceae bacterium]
MKLLGIALALTMMVGVAAADISALVGVQLRTDPGVHQARVHGGVRGERFEATLVVDPLYFTDGEHDLDLVGAWRPSAAHPAWAVTAGWRTVTFDLAGGTRLHQHLLAGATVTLPCVVRGVRAELGFELAFVAVQHGAGLGTDVFPTDDRVLDVIQPAMYLRIEHAWEL